MTTASKNVYGVTGEKPAADIGLFIKRSGVILSASQSNLDTEIYNYQGQAQFFKFLQVGVGGDIVWLSPENQPCMLRNVPNGCLFPAVGYQVLSSANINSYDSLGSIISTELVFTTCLDIQWLGGE